MSLTEHLDEISLFFVGTLLTTVFLGCFLQAPEPNSRERVRLLLDLLDGDLDRQDRLALVGVGDLEEHGERV